MSNNEDDAVTGQSEQADGTRLDNGEMEPKYARSERLDRPTHPLPEQRAPGGPPAPGTPGGPPVATVVVRQQTPRAVWVAVIAVIVLLVIVIIVLLLRPTGGGAAATVTPTPTSTSTSSSKSAPTSLPTTSAAPTTSQPTTSASTAPAGGSIPATVTLTYASYVDLDTMYPSTTAGGQDEIWIGQDGITFGTSGSWAKTRVVLVPTNAISKQACDTSTVLATGGSLDKKNVGPDQSVCVSTSGGKWVVLTSQDHKFSSDDPAYYNQYTFATQVFPGPQPT